MAGIKGEATLGGVPTKPVQPKPAVKTTRVKARQTKKGLTRARIPAKLHDPVNAPPLSYKRGPFNIPVERYDFRLYAREGSKMVTLDEIESIQWDDASAVMTGSVTLREPDPAGLAGVPDGNQVVCEYRQEGGAWTGLWTMRIVSPTKTVENKQRTYSLANDLQRLVDSTDTFKFVKGKLRPLGWRTDQAIKSIFDAYGIEIAPGGLPKMNSRITNWTLIDQHPLDVVHSALTRERNVTGIKYALRLDAQGRAVISAFKRPTQLYRLGVALMSAVYSVTRHPRFATALTVRAQTTSTSKDKKGHKKAVASKISVSMSSKGAIKRYGFVHRNIYSPDATSNATALNEGNQFLAAVAISTQQIQGSMSGMPTLRRLDAIRFDFPADKISQVVYITDASHSVGGGTYTTTFTASFDDPFVDRKIDQVVAKLADTAIIRARKATVVPVTVPKPSKAASRTRVKADPTLGSTATHPTKTAG